MQTESFDGSYKENRLDRIKPRVYILPESRWSIGRVEMTLPPGLHDAGRCGTWVLLFLPPKPLESTLPRGFIFWNKHPFSYAPEEHRLPFRPEKPIDPHPKKGPTPPGKLCGLNFACALVPYGQAFVEVGVICHVAGDGSIFPVNRILNGRLPRAYRLHKVIHVVDLVVINRRSRKAFRGLDERYIGQVKARDFPCAIVAGTPF